MQKINEENELEYMIEDEHSIKEENLLEEAFPFLKDIMKTVDNLQVECSKITKKYAK